MTIEEITLRIYSTMVEDLHHNGQHTSEKEEQIVELALERAMRLANHLLINAQIIREKNSALSIL